MESPDDDGGGEYACLASNAYAAAMAKYDRLARRYNVAMRSHKVMQIIETDTQKALDPLGDAVEVLQRTAVQQDGRILLTRLQAAEVVDGFPMVKEAVGPLMVPTDEEMKMMEEAMLHNLYTKPQAIVLGPGLCQPPSTRTFENFTSPSHPSRPRWTSCWRPATGWLTPHTGSGRGPSPTWRR